MLNSPMLEPQDTSQEVQGAFFGYKHQGKIGNGEFFDTMNLSTDDYPMLANRKKRGRVAALTSPSGLLAKDKLAYVDNCTLYYDGAATTITGLTAGKKRLVSMGAYICVFPDKKYYNTADPTDCGNMEAYYTTTGSVQYSLCKVDGTEYATPTISATAPASPENGALWVDTSGEQHLLKQYSAALEEWSHIPTVYTRLRFVSQGEIPGLFSEYDGITISGADVDAINGDKVIYALGGGGSAQDYIVVVGLLEQAMTQTTGSVSFSRSVPDMDFVCECQNRLWGCRYGNDGGKNLNEIYCCALGDFKNWRQYRGISTDSWTASVGSDGPWTGAINYLGYPTFFKENMIHRVSVSSYGAHTIEETPCRGVQKGSEKSLAIVNETLFYKSRAEICAYQGGFPVSVSDALGDEIYTNAAAGVLGDKYYVSMCNGLGVWNTFVYDIPRSLWVREDDLHVEEFAAMGDELYCFAGDWLVALMGTEGTLEPFVSWMAESGMLYYQYPNKKYISRMNIRIKMEEGAVMNIFAQYDSAEEWVRIGTVRKKGTGTINVPIRPRRCDHLRIRLEGKGEFRLFSIARILEIGSDM